MLLQYDKIKIKNLYMHQEAMQWLLNKQIDKTDFEKMLVTFQPAYKRNNFLYTFGMFMLTLLIGNSALSFVALLLGFSESNINIIMIAGICFSAYYLRKLIDKKNVFQNGVDYGLQYIIAGNVCYLFFDFISPEDFLSAALYFFATSLFFTIMFLAYIHFVWIVLSFISISTCVSVLFLHLNPNAILFLPFVLMAISVGVYFIAKRLFTEAHFYLHFGITCLQASCIMIFYVSCNYYLIDQIYYENYQSHPTGWVQWLFTTLTVLVPLIYIYNSLKKHNHTQLTIGLLALLASVFVIRNYYGMLPLAYALITGGIALLICVWLARKFLTEKSGFTFNKPKGDKEVMQWISFAMAQWVQVQNAASQTASQSQGGGQFGGGGAGNSY